MPATAVSLSEFEAAAGPEREAMFAQGRIARCEAGLVLPRDSFCIDGQASSLDDLSFLVAHLPDGAGLVLRGGSRMQVGGTAQLGWITFEPVGSDRVITHLDPGTSTSAAENAPTPAAESADDCFRTDLGTITRSVSQSGRWSSSDCVLDDGTYADVYSFRVSQTTRVVIELSSSTADTYLVLTSPPASGARWGESIAIDDDGGDGLDSRISRTLSAGTYELIANRYGAGETGSYTLTVSPAQAGAAPAETPAENGDDCFRTDLGTITRSVSQNGRWSSSDCVLEDGTYADVYSFRVSQTTRVVIELSSNTADTYLVLASPPASGVRWGESIATDDDGGDGLDSRISRTLSAGTYELIANRYGAGETGSYTLTVSPAQAGAAPAETPEPGGACRAGMTLRSGDYCTVSIPGISVGTDRFEIRGTSGCYGGICSGNSVNLSGFRASRSGSTWTIEAVP